MDIMYFNYTSDHPPCWIRIDNGKNILHDPGHECEHNLPRVKIAYIDLLEENGIPYRYVDGNEEVEIWNPMTVNLIENLTLPLYCVVNVEYKFIEMHSEWVPTKQAVAEATEFFWEVVVPLIED